MASNAQTASAVELHAPRARVSRVYDPLTTLAYGPELRDHEAKMVRDEQPS